MEPTFDYPSADSRHVFIKCEKDDPRAYQFWCPRFGHWYGCTSPCIDNNHNCGQIWRKKVEVPVGYQLLKQGDIIPDDAKLLDLDGVWIPSVLGGQKVNTAILIRPIKPAEEGIRTTATITIGTKPANYYARQIKGVEIDVYDILSAYKVDNHAVAHAVKKLLRLGNGQKERLTDIQEAKQSLERAGELEAK